MFVNIPLYSSLPDISASNLEGWDAEAFALKSDSRKKKSFTVWSTLFSTHTLTSTFYFSGTTVTVSGVCSVAGLDSSCFG